MRSHESHRHLSFWYVGSLNTFRNQANFASPLRLLYSSREQSSSRVDVPPFPPHPPLSRCFPFPPISGVWARTSSLQTRSLFHYTRLPLVTSLPSNSTERRFERVPGRRGSFLTTATCLSSLFFPLVCRILEHRLHNSIPTHLPLCLHPSALHAKLAMSSFHLQEGVSFAWWAHTTHQ